jgi:8-oxo-dGTP pyrophosphatase MutT (NUDIX family)
MDQPKTDEVRAAGGIVYRRGPGGHTEIVVIHRPARDDWSLPKGKPDEGETLEQTALREVEEETGLRCVIVRPAGTTRYRDGADREKVVTYWVMRSLGGHFQPNNEVDQLRWATIGEALQLLTYAEDQLLVEAEFRT